MLGRRYAARAAYAAIGLVSAVLAAGCATPLPSVTASQAPTSAASPSTASTAPSPSPSPVPTPSQTPSPTPASSSGPPSSTPNTPPSSAVYVTHGSRATRTVALTFDDGFNVPACISIVHTLIDRHATATFFPNGQYVREAPSFWHWVAARGFAVGNHGTTHHDPTTLSAQQLLLSLGSERRILDESLGVPSIDAYRPPYGSFNSLVLQVAGLAGYPLAVGWDVDSRDQLDVATVAQEVANATAGTNGSSVILHCGAPLTPLALPAIIDDYLARGFSFVTIPQMFGLSAPAAAWSPPLGPDAWPTTLLPGTGDQPAWNASIAIDQAGHVHVASETPDGIVYADDVAGSLRSTLVAPETDSVFVSRPAIAVDAAGAARLAYLSATASGSRLLYRQQGNDGTWSSPSVVAALGAPASTATIAIDRSGHPLVAYARHGGPNAGIVLATPGTSGWLRTVVPTTDRSFLSPSVTVDPSGAIHLFERRSGYSEIDETTNASGAWATATLLRVPGSGVPFGAFDPSGQLVVAVQPSFGGEIDVGRRSANGALGWTTITAVGDLSGLAIAQDASFDVAFSRILPAGWASRIWIARSPA